MIDVNIEAEKSLALLDENVVYQYPESFGELPVISYYNVAECGAFYYDNDERIQEGHVQVDVWSDVPYECGEIAIKVNDAMTQDGWTRELSMDVPKNNEKIYHKTMRFQKYFNL